MFRVYEDGENPLVRTVDQLHNAITRFRSQRAKRKPVSFPLMQLKRRLPIYSANNVAKKRFQFVDAYCQFRIPLTCLNPHIEIVLVRSDGSELNKQIFPSKRHLMAKSNFDIEWARLIEDLRSQHGFKLTE
jgi:hypothetical protein